jgi:adenylyltransferase/sulfurtransferase
MPPEITVAELAEKLKSANPPLLIDVRQANEFAYCRIPGAELRPLGEIQTWARDLDPEAEIVLQCHSGLRSAQAANYLARLGFKHVYNLEGGIDAWAEEIDPNMPRY